MKNYKKNLKILEDGHVYSKEMEKRGLNGNILINN